VQGLVLWPTLIHTYIYIYIYIHTYIHTCIHRESLDVHRRIISVVKLVVFQNNCLAGCNIGLWVGTNVREEPNCQTTRHHILETLYSGVAAARTPHFKE
jgi:hypothetical protein